MSPNATFREAVELGQPDDKGLFFPSEIPKFSSEFLASLSTRSSAEIAFDIMRPYVGGEIPDGELFQICSASIDFPFPLVRLTPRISVLELFHGPTLAFKDVGARFMSGCLGYFSRSRATKTLVIVATSGDTGGAVAAGFEGVENVSVVILYPKDRVTVFQAEQVNTKRVNVLTLEVRGSFDDCQALAKRALADSDLRKRALVTSANSINIARWLPQQFYYAFAMKDWDGQPPVFSVPSGNFGNIAAGALANASGLPVNRFIAACNANDTFPRFLQSGVFEPRPSIETLSNAMDVGDPSNFSRLMEIFDNDISPLRRAMEGQTVSDAETIGTIKQVFAGSNYVLDPHTAVGHSALSNFLAKRPDQLGIVLGTAHPGKFEVVNEIIGNYDVKPNVKSRTEKAARPNEVNVSYDELREILTSLM